MIEFSSTQLKRESKSVLDAVESQGWVTIKNRRRPTMVLMTEETLKLAFKECAYQALVTEAERLEDVE